MKLLVATRSAGKQREVRRLLEGSGLDSSALSADIDGRFMSAFVRATKPAEAAKCCGSECCA